MSWLDVVCLICLGIASLYWHIRFVQFFDDITRIRESLEDK